MFGSKKKKEMQEKIETLSETVEILERQLKLLSLMFCPYKTGQIVEHIVYGHFTVGPDVSYIDDSNKSTTFSVIKNITLIPSGRTVEFCYEMESGLYVHHKDILGKAKYVREEK